MNKIALAFIALLLMGCNDEMETTNKMWGYAHIVEYRGMTCIEYRRDRGGSLQCDWQSDDASPPVRKL